MTDHTTTRRTRTTHGKPRNPCLLCDNDPTTTTLRWIRVTPGFWIQAHQHHLAPQTATQPLEENHAA